MAQLPAALRTSRPEKLREAALAQRDAASKLRKELSATKEALETVDFWGEAFAAGCGVAGNAATSALRGFGTLEGREHLEPLAAVALGFIAQRSESPALLHFAVGVAQPWIGDVVERRTRELRAAMNERKAATEAAKPAEASTVTADVRAGIRAV